MIVLKLVQIDGATAAILPPEILARLGLEEGGAICLTETAGGGMRVSALSPDVAKEVALGEALMDEYKETFEALAR